jgi:hypothetical protein
MNREDANHLINVIGKYYPMTVDEEATNTLDSQSNGNIKKQKAHIHMPGYLQKAFTRFKHKMPVKIQNSPHPHVIPQYGAKTQYAKEDNESPPLSKEETKYIQAVAGTLLYYARAVDATIPPSLSLIATKQAKPTQEIMKTVKQLLDYCATQEEAVITYNASKMILAVHSDAGYCNKKNARSQAGGNFFLSNDEKFPPNNGVLGFGAIEIAYRA